MIPGKNCIKCKKNFSNLFNVCRDMERCHDDDDDDDYDPHLTINTFFNQKYFQFINSEYERITGVLRADVLGSLSSDLRRKSLPQGIREKQVKQ